METNCARRHPAPCALRRVRLAARHTAVRAPTGDWAVQQARNPALTLGERSEDIRFLIGKSGVIMEAPGHSRCRLDQEQATRPVR